VTSDVDQVDICGHCETWRATSESRHGEPASRWRSGAQGEVPAGDRARVCEGQWAGEPAL